MDVFDKEKRSLIMARIKGKHTSPEMIVRKLVHNLGYRYRLHDKSLPGKPDLVFRGKGKIIFVHGCFWHRHNCKRGESIPDTHVRFWKEKLRKNQQRDKSLRKKLKGKGWNICIVWECQTKHMDALADRLIKFLES